MPLKRFQCPRDLEQTTILSGKFHDNIYFIYTKRILNVFVYSEHYYDRDSRRYAILALGNLAMSRFTHDVLMTERCLDALKSSLQVDGNPK